MQKSSKIKKIDIEKEVMSKVTANEITMRPHWYFVAGSLLTMTGLISFGVMATFLTNLSLFILKSHGPMKQWRLQQIISTFPIWIPILALVGIILGIILLKKYDFSYKKNFGLIILGFIVSIILTAFFLNYTGLDNIWMKRKPMQRFYQQNLNPINNSRSGIVKGWNHSQNRNN